MENLYNRLNKDFKKDQFSPYFLLDIFEILGLNDEGKVYVMCIDCSKKFDEELKKKKNKCVIDNHYILTIQKKTDGTNLYHHIKVFCFIIIILKKDYLNFFSSLNNL